MKKHKTETKKHKTPRHDKQVLLSIADGPEHIEFYTSEDEAVIDFGTDIPGLYMTASVNGVHVKLGPFHLRSIRTRLVDALKEPGSRERRV